VLKGNAELKNTWYNFSYINANFMNIFQIYVEIRHSSSGFAADLQKKTL